MTQSRHLMMKLQAVGIVPRSITYSHPWIEAARLDARNATSSAIPSGDGRHDGLNSELRLRLRNEYAPCRVFVAGRWVSVIPGVIPAGDVPPQGRKEASPKRRGPPGAS